MKRQLTILLIACGLAMALWMPSADVTAQAAVLNNNKFENNIVWIKDSKFGIYLLGGLVFSKGCDYNCFYRSNPPVWVGYYGGSARLSLANWQDATGYDTNSIYIDPLFVDAANGDFHLNSVAGHWNESTTSWDTDATTSPCIDAGDPSADYSNEPYYNGDRINQGAYGNTIYASKTPPPTISGSRPLNSDVMLYVNGALSDSDNDVDGSYSINLSASADDVIHVVITGGTGNNKGAAIGKYSGSENITANLENNTVIIFNNTITNSDIGMVEPSGVNDPYDYSSPTLTTESGVGIKILSGATYAPNGDVTVTSASSVAGLVVNGTLAATAGTFRFHGNCSITGSTASAAGFSGLTIGNANFDHTNSSVDLSVSGTLDFVTGGGLYMDGGKVLTVAGAGKLRMHKAYIRGVDGTGFGDGCRIVMDNGADIDLDGATFRNLGNEGLVLWENGSVINNFTYVDFYNDNASEITEPYVYLKIAHDSWNESTWSGPIHFYCKGATWDEENNSRDDDEVHSLGFTTDDTWITFSKYRACDNSIYGHDSCIDYGFKNNTSGANWGSPTFADVVGFTAEPYNGAVLLRWSTGVEINNLGFNVYRSTSPNGPWERVNPHIITGLGSTLDGGDYYFIDYTAENGVRYYSS